MMRSVGETIRDSAANRAAPYGLGAFPLAFSSRPNTHQPQLLQQQNWFCYNTTMKLTLNRFITGVTLPVDGGFVCYSGV